MFDRIVIADDITLIGKCIETTLSENKTKNLWQSFRPRLNEIKNTIGSENYSIQIYYGIPDTETFNPQTTFWKWAAVQVSEITSIPEGMDSLTIKGGMFAVFIHKGTVLQFNTTADYIYNNWLPSSKYELDDRAHFEILNEKYLGPMNENSEEEVWIPIKNKISER